jgi:hypothetical protein
MIQQVVDTFDRGVHFEEGTVLRFFHFALRYVNSSKPLEMTNPRYDGIKELNQLWVLIIR